MTVLEKQLPWQPDQSTIECGEDEGSPSYRLAILPKGLPEAARETIAAKGKAPGHIQSLVTAIKPAVEATAKDDLETTIKANVKHVVDTLRASTPILKAKVDSGDVKVIGGYYSLDTGAVTFLDEK